MVMMDLYNGWHFHAESNATVAGVGVCWVETDLSQAADV